ncbi:hypothetical protein HSX37_08425|uniref:Membrane domain of glycerophosphoryl diester phosphodiesterase n=1 Tax=Dendrosporobacter quercicolus TaxID=146817 RepID=A0A1G9UQ42_9FIRM|nr:hypothetical protein [Dendrosporobacter quercicolus]NSL48068.1 hypothetical protein [Dendrosporobacter quercicolus DSM 1736]SDM61984.1 hypothetical protein SAMN04488502_10622 [Dendrosporobacter quercicolus]
MNFQPRSLGEILDSTFSMYKAQFNVYMKISLLQVLVFTVGALIVAGGYSAMGESGVVVIGAIIFIAVVMVNIGAVTGIVHIASEQLSDRHIEVKDALLFGFRKIAVQVASTILYGIAITLGFILFILPGIYLANAFILFIQVNALESTGPWAGLKRSRELSKGSWWRIAAIIFLMSLLVGIMSLIIQLPLNLLTQVLSLDVFSKMIADNLVATITGSLFMPVTGISYTLLYYDLRVRKENFDLHSAVEAVTDTTNL